MQATDSKNAWRWLRKIHLQTPLGQINAARLPRYLVIGPIGSGKTTMIVKGGLPLYSTQPFAHSLDDERLLTRKTCNWWISHVALFLDIPGLWLHKPEMTLKPWLSSVLAQRSFEGILLVLEGCTVLKSPEKAILDQGKALSILAQSLKKFCPVYLILNQLDRISGFQAFFSDLTPKDCKQPWGFSLPKGSIDLLARCHQGFSDWLQPLQAQVVTQLQATYALEDRRLIQQFPAQMACLQESGLEVVRLLERHLHPEGRLPLRGVYGIGHSGEFTESAPCSALQDRLIQAYGLSPDQDVPEDLAPTATLSVISPYSSQLPTQIGPKAWFSENWLASLPLRKGRMGLISWRLSGWIMLGLLWIVATGLLIQQYRKHLITLNQVQLNFANYLRLTPISKPSNDPSEAALVPLLIRLDYLAEAQNRLQSLQGLDFLRRRKLLQQTIQHRYQEILQALWPILLKLSEKTVRRSILPQKPDVETAYFALKAWHFLRSDSNLQWQKAFLLKHLVNSFNSTDLRFKQVASEKSFQTHVSALLMQKPTLQGSAYVERLQPEPVWIEAARALCRTLSVEQLVWLALKSEFLGADPVFPFQRVANTWEIAGLNQAPMDLSPLYTDTQFGKVYDQVIPRIVLEILQKQGDWAVILGADWMPPPVSPDKVIQSARSIWLKNYAHCWKTKLASFQTQWLNQSKKKPFMLFYRHVFKNAISSWEGVLSQLTQHTTWPSLSMRLSHCRLADQDLIQTQLSQAFKPLYTLRMGVAGQLKSRPIDRLSDRLKTLAHYLKPILEDTEIDQAAFILNRKRFANLSQNDPVTDLSLLANILPEPIQTWARSIAQQVGQSLLTATQRHLNRVWYQTVFLPYDQTIQGRYPIFKKSLHNIALQDFITFFGPQGVIAQYQQKYLLPFVETTGSRWKLRKREGQTIGLSTIVMTELERAQVIQALFFRKNSITTLFKMRLINLAPKLTVTLHYAGKRYQFTTNNLGNDVLEWPVKTVLDSEEEQSLIFQIQADQSVGLSQHFSGDWAWFRFLDWALSAVDQQRVLLTPKLGPYTVTYELSPLQATHPFVPGIIERFRCPPRLTD